ncbi:MAG: 5-(carboxyamino)imidazole ribonucleotide synthase [Anaerolineales bacterium]|nr:5-(carboxyamino)imidazole ribonucleotide synthase [Anaerolineales bacterium]MCZ2122128.1 5-(carboxyamino)imidazole ribonucleotide synthase [Anaerolineales bacterium]
MKKIGVLGAGQLGRMLALAGYPLGHRFRFFDSASDSPAGLLADHWAFDYADTSALEKFAQGLDVVTYEFENVPVETVRHLEKFVPVYPSAIALEKAQDRFVEKSFFRELGIPTAKFSNGLRSGQTDGIGFPAVLKTRRMGYDGKGQVVINSEADLDNGLPLAKRISGYETDDLILEEFIKFERELSIIAVRNKSREMKFYPLIENHHRDGILRLSIAGGDVSAELQKQAEEYARAVMNALDYVGVLTIEFFEKDGRLLANEMAPRVHNSGHWTIEGSITSQFENHVRAVSDAPLGSTNPLGVCGMVNLVGNLPDVEFILKIEGAHLHLYDKAPRAKRKIGHITFVEKDMQSLQKKIEQVKEVYELF